MADWRDSIQDASINGVPVYANSRTMSTGRRTTSRELPFRDTPAREDLGRSARKYEVDLVVIGLDYMIQLQDVLDVLESPGPYLYVDPWRGELSVILAEGSSVNIEENHSQGGWAKISVQFVESGDPDGASITTSTSSALSVAAVAAIDAVKTDTPKKMKLGLGGVFNAAAKAVGKISSTMLKSKRKVMGTLGVTQAAGLSDSLADLNTNVNKLLNTPAELLTTLSGLVAGLKTIFTDFSAAEEESPNAPYPGRNKKIAATAAISMAQELSAIDTVTPPPFPGGPQDEDEVAAEKALSKAVGVMTIAETIDLFGGDIPLESSEVAIESLKTLGTLADDVLLDTDTSDDLYVAMTDLRAALDKHLAYLAASLPQVQTYTPPKAMSALLIAYQFYGDPKRDLEIVGRNRVSDPNFVPGGVPLEVLVDA